MRPGRHAQSWTDVVDDRDSETAERRHQAEIEVGKIDCNEDVRPQLARGVNELAQHRKRSRNDLDGFGDAGHRQRAVVGDQAAAGILQARPAEPKDFRVWHTASQFSRQRTCIHVT